MRLRKQVLWTMAALTTLTAAAKGQTDPPSRLVPIEVTIPTTPTGDPPPGSVSIKVDLPTPTSVPLCGSHQNDDSFKKFLEQGTPTGITPTVTTPESRTPLTHDGAVGRVYALVIIDEGSGLPGLESNREGIETILRSVVRMGNPQDGPQGAGLAENDDPDAVDPSQMVIIPKVVPTLSPEMVLEWVRELPISQNDTVFVFISCHGATDPDRGHFLALSDGELSRQELKKVMANPGQSGISPRLAVLLTDCCSSVGRLRSAPSYTGRGAGTKIVRDLLYRHSGFVDITAATFDASRGIAEYGWFVGRSGGTNQSEPVGGIFTFALVRTLLTSSLQELDRNRNGAAEWSEVYPRVVRETNNSFLRLQEQGRRSKAVTEQQQENRQKLLNQEGQHPQQFGLGRWSAGMVRRPDHPRYLLEAMLADGSYVERRRGNPSCRVNGVLLGDVTVGGAGDLAGLRPGYLILAVNDARVECRAALVQRLNDSDGNVRLTVRKMNGKIVYPCVQLKEVTDVEFGSTPGN